MTGRRPRLLIGHTTAADGVRLPVGAMPAVRLNCENVRAGEGNRTLMTSLEDR